VCLQFQLFHAIKALAQLALAGAQTPDSLEHYQQVIPALQTIVQSSQDSFSDGALFTHFILLLYEITAALHGGSNMAQHHGNQLLRIIRLRRQANNVEPFEFIVWTVASSMLISSPSLSDLAKVNSWRGIECLVLERYKYSY
jgi:hypothetical protein